MQTCGYPPGQRLGVKVQERHFGLKLSSRLRDQSDGSFSFHRNRIPVLHVSTAGTGCAGSPEGRYSQEAYRILPVCMPHLR